MGYRVEYLPADRAFCRKRGKIDRVPVLCALFFALFACLVQLFWEDGRDAIGMLLFPGDWRVAGLALEGMVEQLRMGESFGTAATVFCREIIGEAGIGIG